MLFFLSKTNGTMTPSLDIKHYQMQPPKQPPHPITNKTKIKNISQPLHPPKPLHNSLTMPAMRLHISFSVTKPLFRLFYNTLYEFSYTEKLGRCYFSYQKRIVLKKQPSEVGMLIKRIYLRKYFNISPAKTQEMKCTENSLLLS